MKPLFATITAMAALSLGVILFLTSDRDKSPPSTANTLPLTNMPTNKLSLSLTEAATGPIPHSGIRLGQSTNFSMLQNDQGFTLSNPVPFHLDRHLDNQPLHPGVYQTYPYSIILAVPGRGIDDGILGERPRNNSKMPVVKPHVEAIPRS